MINSRIKKSIRESIKTHKSALVLFNAIIAIVACFNFITTLISLDVYFLFDQLLKTYRAIVHQPLDWIYAFFELDIPWFFNDILFFYLLIGGGFIRARKSEGSIYDTLENSSLLNAFKAFILKKSQDGHSYLHKRSRLQWMYMFSPMWLKRTLDFILWPRVLDQYWRLPKVYENLYNGSIQRFSTSYEPGGGKVFLYDRRVYFLTHLFVIVLGVSIILVLNGFLII